MRLASNKTNWDKEIEISVSVRELQIIRDCVAGTSYKILHDGHKFDFDNEPPYNDDNVMNLYNETETILKEQGGKTNNDIIRN